ncbi:MAG TPA: hypothetical protein VFN10_20075 [Thermoanaerobaculia bacterium]|nr:hypothetical protein [Thermoanaerobaculia bacterium]
MSKAARSLFAFGIYVVITALGFIAAPEMLMSLLGLPPATAGWARLIGLLALVIGAYDIVGARSESLAYIRASVYVRTGFALGTFVLVALGQMPPTILLLGASDIAGAIWTALALRGHSPAVATA